MRVLGINDGHNAAACLYEDGHMVAAVQEERLRRVKNWAGMPTQSINFVLHTAGITPSQVDWVAMNGYHAAYTMTREQLMEEYRGINNFDVTLKRKLRRISRGVVKSLGLLEQIRERRQDERVKELIAEGIPKERIEFVEHHTAHASAAYYGWANFSDDVL